jgi:hypothetical protein
VSGRFTVTDDLVHAEAGPLATFTTREDAEAERAAVLRDEPS